MKKKKQPTIPIAVTEPPASPVQPRRRALRTGLAAGAASLFLPAQWTRPLVQSVILPAHAQTSRSTEEEFVCQAVTIPGRVLSCEDGDGYSAIRVTFELEGECIMIAGTDTCGGCLWPIESDQLLLVYQVADGVIEISVTSVAGGIYRTFDDFQVCSPAEESWPAGIDDSPNLGLDVGGKRVRASFSFTVTETTVEHSEITVGP